MTAPYDCVVKTWSLPDPKKTLTNDHYVELIGTKVLKIELSVNEDEVLLVQKGNPATVRVDATDTTYDGEVAFVSDIGEYSGGTSDFSVQVLFNNDGKLKLGMNGKAKIVLDEAKNVIGVPVDAVFDDGENSYVTVQNGDKTKDVKVETGIKNKKYVEIKSGLKEGDEVVILTYDDYSDDKMMMY